MKNKFYLIVAMMVLAAPFAWYNLLFEYQFKLLPASVENNVEIKLFSDGKAINVSIFNDSDYTIGAARLICTTMPKSVGDCSLNKYYFFGSEEKNNPCWIVAGDVIHDSLIHGFVFPGASYNKYFETERPLPQNSLFCTVENSRGYKSLWFEKLVGHLMK